MNATDIAEQFARTLDAEDYAAAEALLGENCEYACRGELHRGPSAIIESYRGNGDSAKRDFDAVEYGSTVVGVENNTALIEFTDQLSHKAQHFTFTCQQHLEIDANQRIIRIVHRDLPGQREALGEFMQQVGLKSQQCRRTSP